MSVLPESCLPDLHVCSSRQARPIAAGHIRSGSRRCRLQASATTGDGSGDLPKSKQDMLDRIRKAKQYREQGGTSSPEQAASLATPPAPPTPPAQPSNSAQPPVLTTVLPASPAAPQAQPSVAAKRARDVSETGYSSYGEVVEEMGDWEEGKRFKDNRDAAFAKARSGGFSRSGSPPVAPAAPASFAEQPKEDIDPLTGTAQQAADFLREALASDDGQQNQNERPEIFTLLQEDRQKQKGADIVSVRQGYSASTSAVAQTAAAETEFEPTDYTPKISTWGRFPRPANISEAYGGGRTIRQGEALESEEVAQARKQRIAEALSRYKQTSGTIVDASVEAAAQALFQEAEALFKEGLVAAAGMKYAESAEGMPLRTQLGGQARLQHAICLDSLGQGQEAHSIYRSLSRHPTSYVAKRANQMVFGFRSMDYLKTHTISYSATAEQYAPYFTRMMSDYSSYYAGTPEGSVMEKDEKWPLIIAAAVMITPILLLAGLVISR